MKSKKMLCEILRISDKKWLKKSHVQQNIKPFIDINFFGKKRLIESPKSPLKTIQKKIKNLLLKIEYPDYVYSGVKKKSHIDNAKKHKGIKYIYKVDIKAFFPSISRNKVYNFFLDYLKTSPDIADCLTNFCTYDLTDSIEKSKELQEFIKIKKIKKLNHLCTGSSPSSLLSYLTNVEMFDEINKLALSKDIEMTVFVDDIIFSSFDKIDKLFRKKILSIIKSYGFKISEGKIKYYTRRQVKKVTGVIINKNGNIDVPNKLRMKINKLFNNGKINNDEENLKGCVIAARQISNVYPNIKRFIFNKST